jgi:hypothetical protein
MRFAVVGMFLLMLSAVVWGGTIVLGGLLLARHLFRRGRSTLPAGTFDLVEELHKGQP